MLSKRKERITQDFQGGGKTVENICVETGAFEEQDV